MSKEFKREERYIVIKLKSLDEKKLGWLRDVIRLNDIPTVNGVVVEADWPEYEPTWAAIERRVTGAPAWVGIGPPPSGTVCELRNVAAGTEWAEATIVFASRNVIVWDWDGEPAVNGLCTAYAHAVEIRPVRTPEQIAADKLQLAVQQIMVDAGITDSALKDDPEAWVWAQALYEAGYRKQVAPKKERVLTDEAQEDRDAFERHSREYGGCSCHISPPCGHCAHPGNPLNQEDDSCWREVAP